MQPVHVQGPDFAGLQRDRTVQLLHDWGQISPDQNGNCSISGRSFTSHFLSLLLHCVLLVMSAYVRSYPKFWWNRMYFLLVKAIGCKVIPLVRSIFIGQKHGPYHRDVHALSVTVILFRNNPATVIFFLYSAYRILWLPRDTAKK